MTAAHRQLLVGLDAMEWTLVTRWAREGRLPTFRRLIEQGTSGPLATTSSQLPDTVWASLYTGTNPGQFEKFFYVQYDAESMGLRHVMDDAIKRPPFWDFLSDAGVRVGVVDVPRVCGEPEDQRLSTDATGAPTRPRPSGPQTPATCWTRSLPNSARILLATVTRRTRIRARSPTLQSGCWTAFAHTERSSGI